MKAKTFIRSTKFFNKTVFISLLFLGLFCWFLPRGECYQNSNGKVQIKGVQSGEVRFDYNDISQTVELTAVDDTKSIVLLYPYTDQTATNNSQNSLFVADFESHTSLVISRDGGSVACTVRYYVIEFLQGVSVQRGISSFAPGSYTNPDYISKSITLGTSVDSARAMVLVQTKSAISTYTADQQVTIWGYLSNDNTLILERNDSNTGQLVAANVIYQIVEFSNTNDTYPDFTFWKGTCSIAQNSLTATATLSPAISNTGKALLFYNYKAGRAVGGYEPYYKTSGVITNATTLTFTRSYQNNAANTQVDIRYNVIEFKDQSSFNQKGLITVASGTADASGTLTTGADITRSFPVLGISGPNMNAAMSSGNTNIWEDEVAFGIGFDSARAVAIDTAGGYLYNLNYASNSITKWNLTTGAVVATYNNNAASTDPRAICYDSTTGSIWIANYASNNVTKMNASNGSTVVYALPTASSNPIDICFDSTDGMVWTANYYGYEYDPSDNTPPGNVVTKININNGTGTDYRGAYATSNTAYQYNPCAIGYDPINNKVWSAYNGTSYVNLYSNTGYNTAYSILPSNYGWTRLAFARTSTTTLAYDTMWAVSPNNYVLYRFRTPTGASASAFATDLTPRDTVWEANSKCMFTTCYGSNTILKMDSKLASGANAVLGYYNAGINPWGVTTDASNNLWMTNSGSNNVMKFSNAGALLATYSRGVSYTTFYVDRYNTNTTYNSNNYNVLVNWQMPQLSSVGVLSPNGGEVWRVGQTQNIKIVYAGSEASSTFDILLSTDHGATYPLTIASATTLSSYQYPWTIPETLGAGNTNLMQNSLRIRAIVHGTVTTDYRYDDSNADFEIKGQVQITAPNGGETWIVGDTNRNITWTKNGNFDNAFNAGFTFGMKLSLDGGSTYNTSVATGLLQSAVCSGSNCTWTWTSVPDQIGSNRSMRVFVDGDSANVHDESDANFTIKGKLQIVAPNGSEQWLTQSSQNITWKKWGTFANVNLMYSLDNGVHYYTYLPDPPGTSANLSAGACTDGSTCGSYAWTVSTGAIGTNTKIKIISVQTADVQVSDESDNPFSVVASLHITSPIGSSVWVASGEADINWDVFGSISLVDLWWSKDGNAPWTRLTPAGGITADNGGGHGTYHWNYVDEGLTGATAVIKVALHTSNPAPITPDSNSAGFTVKGKLTLSSPIGGENWLAGTSHNITWVAKGTSLGNVRIKYAADGSNYVLIPELPAPGVAASDQTWTWPTIPSTNKSNIGKIKIELISDSTVNSVSTSGFTIGLLGIDTPASAWAVDDTNHNITWTYEKFAGNVNLYYSVNNGAYSLITTSAVSITNLSYNWTPIPNSISSNVKLKAALVCSDPIAVEAISNAFTIKSGFSFNGSGNAPTSSTQWAVDSSPNINWTTHGTVDKVNLYWSTNGGNFNTITTELSNGFGYAWPSVPDAIGSNTNIKVSTTDSNPIPASGVSDAFTIKGSLQVTAPAGGDVWYKGDTNRVISWFAHGTVTDVKIEYKTSLADTYKTIVADDTGHTAGNNSYTWTAGVPDEKSDTCYIRVTDVNNSNVQAETASVFSIRPKITVSAPALDTVFKVGTTYNNAVQWSLNGSTKVSTVNVYYSTNGSAPYGNTIASNVTASNGQCNWSNVADTISNNVIVQVVDTTNSNVYGLSSLSHIAGSVTITAPNGNEDWTVGATDKNISWTKTGTIGTVNFYADYGSGYVPTAIGSADSAAVSSWNWTPIPDQVSNNCKIKITAANNETYTYSESAAVFHIVGSFSITSPSGAPLVSGTSNPITWTTNGTAVTKVKLEFYNGTSYSTLIDPYDNSGNYPWTVPLTTSSTNCKVRITAATPLQPASAKESSTFWIHGKIDLTSPTTTDKWTVGTQQNVSFNITGTIDHADIYCSNTGGEPYSYTVVSNYAVSSGSNTYQWTLPTNQNILSANQAKLKVADHAYSTVYGVSDNFMIKGTVSLLTPSADNIVMTYGGTPYSITWGTPVGPIQNIKISYSTNDGLTYPNTITASVPVSPATYPWDAPNQIIGKHLKVKIEDASNSYASAESANSFEVIGQLALNSPAGGEKWAISSTKQIQWTPTGTFTSVRIQGSLDNFSTTFLDITRPAGANGVLQTYDWVVTNDAGNSVKIRITDPDHHPETVKVDSPAFKILGSINVTNPKLSPVWYKGEGHDITWDATGNVANVKIEYKTSSGGAYIPITANDSGHSSGPNTYHWASVNDENSEDCYIRVSDVTNYDDVFNVSQVFSIRPLITVSAPAAGTNIRVDSSYTNGVQWGLNGSIKVSAVNVAYSTTGAGGNFNNVIASNVSASDGHCNWDVVPDTMSNNVVVKVVDTINSSAFGLSGVMQIVGNIQIQQPNGSEDWAVGATNKSITWLKHGTIGNINIYVDYGSGYNPTPLATVDTASASSWAWNPIPDQVSNSVKIKLADADNESVTFSESAAAFHIIGSFNISKPDGAPLVTGDADYEIKWTTAGTAVNNVKIEFYDGTSYSTVAASASNSGSYIWPIPATTNSPNCKIKLTASNPLQPATAKESASFWVHGKVAVTEPLTGAQWTVGTQKDIKYNITGKIDNVNITYSVNNGTDNYAYSVASNVATTQGLNTYQWTLPTNQPILSAAQAKIKVTDAAYVTVYDVSPSFMVKGALSLLTPSADNIVMTYGAAPYSITWGTPTGPIQNIKISYSANDGLTYPNTITASVAVSPATYPWDVPNQIIGKHLKVKIEDVNNTYASAESANSFEIIGQVALNAPAGGEKWTVGSTRQIKWTPTGTFTTARLQASTDNFTTTFLDVTQPAGVSGVQQTYNWVITNNISSGVKVRVTDPDHHPETVKSDSPVLSIFGSLSVTNPSSAPVWYKAEAHDITWDATGTITNVKIEYKTSLAGAYNLVVANDPGHTAGSNTYHWTSTADENSEDCYIRVSDVNNYDDSYNVSGAFSIRPLITVSSPAAGTNIRVDSSYTNGVQWSINGSTKVSTVNVKYSTSGSGGSFNNTIASGVTASTGHCDWNVVADTMSNNVVVKVVDTVNANAFGLSGVFQIVGNIQIQQPNGSEDWAVGAADKTVTWLKHGTIGNVNIYVDYGSGYNPTPLATVDTASASSWAWNPIPDHVSNTVKIKIADADNESVTFSESAAVFHIVGNFNISKPDGAPLVTGDADYEIKWTTAGTAVNNVKIEFYDGTSYSTVAANASNSGSYIWTIPATTNSPNCKIKLTASSPLQPATAKESPSFWVHGKVAVTEPLTGAQWTAGTQQNIKYNITGKIDNVNITYSVNNGVDNYAYSVASNVATTQGANTYQWTLPTNQPILSAAQAKIKVTDAAYITVYDVSPSFMVKGALSLTTPSVDNIVMTYGATPYSITWGTPVGPIANIKISYSNNDGVTFPNTITASVAVSPATYPWDVPNQIIGKHLMVKIEDVNNSYASAQSANSFEIRGQLSLGAPNGGQKWTVGSTQQIKWTPTGTFDHVP